MDRSPQQQQLCHIVEEFEAFGNELQGEESIALEDCFRRFLVKLLRARLLNREELDNLVVVWVQFMRVPEHCITLIHLVDTPQKLALQDDNFDVFRIFL